MLKEALGKTKPGLVGEYMILQIFLYTGKKRGYLPPNISHLCCIFLVQRSSSFPRRTDSIQIKNIQSCPPLQFDICSLVQYVFSYYMMCCNFAIPVQISLQHNGINPKISVYQDANNPKDMDFHTKKLKQWSSIMFRDFSPSILSVSP